MPKGDTNRVLVSGASGSDMRKLDTELKLLGFKLVRVGKHKTYRNDDGLTLTMSKTSSDQRSLKNALRFAQRVTRDPSTHPALRRKDQK